MNRATLNLYLPRIAAAGMALFLALATLLTFFPQIGILPIQLLLSGLGLLNFVIHEMGHPVFGLLGTFLGVLGGTLAQLLFPATLAALAWYRQRKLTAMYFVFWIGQNLIQISTYINDARAQQLPLFSPQILSGGKPGHDWNYLLGTLGLLPFDHVIAALVYALGAGVMLFSVVYCIRKIK